MGISGLLPLLKSIQRPTELKKFAGETFAVDAYGWLHRGAITCAADLAQGKPTRRYIDSVMYRVRMVQHFGVTPYLVFDGDFLPSKAGTEASRARRREESCKAGQELLRAGNSKQAFVEFQKAIDITPEMACALIEELKKLGLPYIVAPYEADAQMVYLERKGLVSGILSEDSDLLVFGARRLLTKLDKHGHCIEINRRDFCACREIALTDWTDREFRHMAILSGCDYLEGIGNFGLKTAYRMIRKHKTVEKVIRMAQFDGKFKVSENYLAAFRQAELTFLYQRVFCPVKNELVLLTENTSELDVDEMRFIGDKIDNHLAKAIAVGDVNPITKEPIVLPQSPDKKRKASHTFPGPLSFPGASYPARNSQQQPFGKPIDTYFAKKRESAGRIPLGAMDTNCFAVDRDQVAALTQNGLTPRVFPLPRPYVDGGRTSLPQVGLSPGTSANPQLRRRHTEPLSSLLQLNASSPSTPTIARSRASMLPLSSSSVSGQTRSTPTSARPQKKPKLSPENSARSLPVKTLERSKYFSPAGATVTAAKTTEATPSKKAFNADAFLMSDDSVEEAMMILSDLDGWDSSDPSGKSTQALTVDVFVDTQITEPNDESQDPDLPETCVNSGDKTGSIAAIPESDGVEVPASPSVSSSLSKSKATQPKNASQPTKNSLARPKPDKTPASRLSLGRFSYTNGTRMAHGLATPESSFQGSTASSIRKQRSLVTPPSTAGRHTLARGQKPTVRAPRTSLSDLVQSMSAKRPAKTQQAPVRRIGAPLPINPSFVPLPPVDLAEVEALNAPQGSEDQIIPDSDAEEDENEGDNLERLTNITPNKLDLSRFICP